MASEDGRPAVEGVWPGEKLLRVGNFRVTGSAMDSVVHVLRGCPGEVGNLVLERDGRCFAIPAGVVRFL